MEARKSGTPCFFVSIPSTTVLNDNYNDYILLNYN